MLMDVSMLERHRLFQCESAQQSHAEVAREFSDHGLSWRPGRVRTSMSRLAFDQLSLHTLHYGAEVEVRPRAFHDFLLVHVPLSGVLHVEGDGCLLAGRPGDALLLGSQRALRMRWSEGTRQLILKVPQVCLPEATQVPALMAFDPLQARQLRGLLQALLLASEGSVGGDRGGDRGGGQDPWVTQLEHSVVLFIVGLLHRTDTPPAAREPVPPYRAAQACDQRRVERLMGYLHSRLGAPVGLEDMARATGLSPRGLHLLCQRRLGTTPMVLLRDLRLDAVRARLIESPQTPVTEVAVAHGFSHLGRFAGYYRDRFAELPTQTRRSGAAQELMTV